MIGPVCKLFDVGAIAQNYKLVFRPTNIPSPTLSIESIGYSVFIYLGIALALLRTLSGV